MKNLIAPVLPYNNQALAPYLSEETLNFHYGRHHQTYFKNLQQLIVGTEFADQDLVSIVKNSSGAIFNNAAQVWNHSFYWHCLQPATTTDSIASLTASPFGQAMINSFGDLNQFKKLFTEKALGLFGSGWVWLVKNLQGQLEIVTTNNANNPLVVGMQPLLVCDLWEHAYYIDYRNVRADYLNAFWHLVNWEFVANNFINLAEIN